MSQQPHERSHNHSDDSLTPLGHQNPLGVHHGLGQLGLQTKGLAGGSSLSILDPDIFFPNGLPEIDLSNDEVTPAHQSAPSSQSEQSTSTPSFIQPQRTEHSQSRQTAINQSLQQQSRQPTHQLNKQPSNQATNSTSQLQSNPSNVPTIQPSLDNAPDQPPVNQANSAPSPHPIQRILNDQPEIIPQSAQSLEQTQPAAESSSPPTIQAKEITPESNSAELSAPNQAPHLSAKPIQSKPIEAVAKAQSSRKQQSSNPPKKGTEKLTHTDIQRYFDPQPQTLSESSFSDRSVSDSSEQVVQAQSFTDETNSDNSSSPNTELGSAGDAHPTDNLDLGGAIAPAQPSSSAMAQRLVGNVHPTQISSGDAIAPAQPSLTTSEQQISRSASEPVSPADQQADHDFAASDSTSHSQELSATTPEALQQEPSIQRAASTSDSSSTPEASQQAPSIQQAATVSDDSSQVNPNHQPLATTTASEANKTSSKKETDVRLDLASHSSSSDQADAIINRKATPSSTSNDLIDTVENSSSSTSISSTNESISIQREPESSQTNDSTRPESHPFPAINPAPQNTVNRSADEQSTSVATPSIASESSEPKLPESGAQPPSSTQRKTESNPAPSPATRQERSFLQRYFSPEPKPSSSISASADSPQPKPLSSSQASNNPPANEQPSNQQNPEIASVYELEPIINRSVAQPNLSPVAESIEQSSLTNAEPHADQIQRQESSASSDIGSTEVRSHISPTQSSEHQGIPIQQQSLTDSSGTEVEVRSQPQHSIQQDTDIAAATSEPHTPSQIQQEPENQLEQVNSSTELSATSDNQPSIQAQLESRNILENNQIDQQNNQLARSAQINLDQVKIQQQSAPDSINRLSSIPEPHNIYSEADDTAKDQIIEENLEPTTSTNQPVDSIQLKSDTATHQSISFIQAQTDISSHESVSQTQPQTLTSQPVKPIQKVGNAVNRLMRFFVNQVNPSPTNQTNQLDQTAAAEVQQPESVKTSTTLSEDSRVDGSTLASDLASNSGTQPIQRYSDYTSDQGQSENLNYPEDNVSSLPTESETTFSTKSIIESENLSSKTVRLKSDSENSNIEQSSPLKNQIISSGSDTANLYEAAKPHIPDSATPNPTPDIQHLPKSEQTKSVNSGNSQTDLAKVSESIPNQQIQASTTSSVTDLTISSATSTSIDSEAQSATSTSSNQIAEVDTTSSRLAAELQSQSSSALQPNMLQRSEQTKIEAFTDSSTTPSTESETLSRSPSSNLIGQPDIGSTATSASPINAPEDKDFSHLADDTIQTKTDSTQPVSDLVSADAANQAAQVRNSISEPTRSAESQSADHVQRSSQAEEFSNAVDENLGSASAENMTSDDQLSAKDEIAPDLSSTLHTDTPHKQPLQRQIEDTSSVTAQADTHLQHDIHQSHQQNHSVEPSSSITLETTADSQPTNIQRASALSIEDAIASSATPTIPTPATPNETVQRFTDSNFTAPDEAAQSSHAIVSSLSEPSLDNPISADSSSVSPVVQQSSTDQNILNRNTDEITSTSELSAAQPIHDSPNNSSANNQQSFATDASHQASESSSEAILSIQASHMPEAQTSSSERSAQEVQEALSEGISSIQASSAQTAKSQTSEQPDLHLQQDSDLESRFLPESKNNLQRKSEPESTAISEIETTARLSVEPNTTPQPTAQTPSIQAQSTQVNSTQASSTQASSTQAVPEQLATPDFNQPSAQTPTVQAQSTQTDLEKATINHPELAELIQTDPERVAVAHPEQAQSTQLPSVQAKFTQADSVEDLDQDQPSTQVPSVQAKREQADPEPTGSENLEPNQPAAAASSAQPSPTQPSPAQTPSIQAQTVQLGVEQADSEHVDLNQLSTPEPSVQAKSTQANLEQADSEGLALNQPSIPVPSVQAKPTQVNLRQASSEDLELNQPSTPESSVQANPIHTDLEPAGSEQSVPLQPSTQMPSVQAKSTQVNSVQPSSTQAQSSQINSVQQPLVQAKSAQTNAEHEAASTTDQQVDQTPITVLRPIGILQSLTTTPISTTAIQSKASQDKQIQPQANTEANIQHQNVSLATGSYQDETSAGERLAGNSLPAHTAFSTSNLQRQIAATESVLNESIDAVQFQQTDHSYADQPESHQGLADIQRRPIDQGNQVNQINETNQINSSPNLIESSHSTSQAAEQDSNGMPTPDSIQRSIDYPTANQISTDQPNQPVINRSLADAVAPAANQQSIQPESLLDTSVNQTSGTWTTSETSHQPESHQPRAYNPSASPQVEHTVNPRTGQEAISTPSNLVQRASAEQADQEASTQPNPTSDQIQRSPSTEAHQTAEPLAEPVQPAAQQPDEIQRDQLADQQTDNSQSEAAAQSAQSLSQPQSLSQLPANSIQRNNQLDSPPPADSRPDTGIPTQWSSLADLVEQTQHLSTPTPTESAPGATSGLPNIQRQVDAADSETIQNLTVDVNVVRGEGESAIAPSPSPLPSSSPSIPTQWSSLEDLVQQMPSSESSANTAMQQAAAVQPSQIQRKSTSQIKEKTPKASSAVSSQQETEPKSRSTLQPVRQAGKPRSTLSVSRVAPLRSQSTPAPQTTVQAKFSPSHTNLGATLIQASEDEPFVTISRSGGGSEAAADYAEALELLAQEIYSLLRQRLAIEQERHGAGYPNRFR
ncbi:MAG: hypothetical protein ACTS2F_16345 [Thainema sp.]